MGEDICRCGHRRSRHGHPGCAYEYDHGAGIECECQQFTREGAPVLAADPTSFAVQLEQSRAAIRELLELMDEQTAEIRRLTQVVQDNPS